MATEIADVDGRVSLTVEIEVDQPDSIAVDENLIGVKVAMNAACGMVTYGGNSVVAPLQNLVNRSG
ncbi:MAG: hypothetical protein R3C02_00715 [Planctomycetaceae bacterium]